MDLNNTSYNENSNPIKYKSIIHYTKEIQKAKTPLDILVNTDYLTDLIDKELKIKAIIKNINKQKKGKEIWIKYKPKNQTINNGKKLKRKSKKKTKLKRI